jgi:alkylated DNA repair protein (DNA oxidative demethylase)
VVFPGYAQESQADMTLQRDLFASQTQPQAAALPEGVLVRPSLFDPKAQQGLAAAVAAIAETAPFRHPRTPGQGTFSAALTSCGTVGWWSDRKGYRYIPTQPESTAPWPPMPEVFRTAVRAAAAGTPWPDFGPDTCLINFYGPGARMGLHLDRDERDFGHPIVTVSLGDEADFLVGGAARSDKPTAFAFRSGDVLVMGGAGRMLFHGVRKVYAGTSPIPGLAGRYSLTFRKAL